MLGVSFEEYLKFKNVFIEEPTKDKIKITQENIREQLKVLCEFHKRASGYEICLLNKLDHNIGKMYQNQKMCCRVMLHHIQKIKDNGAKNVCDQYILDEGEKYIEFAFKCTQMITEDLYFKIIRRSMARREVSLGSINFNNYIDEDNVHIYDAECSYDLIEIDCIRLLQKLKKSKDTLDIDNIIKGFCELEGLDNDSYIFIKYLSLYPVDFMKWCVHYRYNKKDMTPQEYKHMIENVLKKERVLLGEGIYGFRKI